jgi:hypothetical protein
MSSRSEWRRFVERRPAELRDSYPCAMPTGRRICPKHGVRIPQTNTVRRRDPRTGRTRTTRTPLSGICHVCHSELYEQLAAEHIAAKERQEGDAV